MPPEMSVPDMLGFRHRSHVVGGTQFQQNRVHVGPSPQTSSHCCHVVADVPVAWSSVKSMFCVRTIRGKAMTQS